MIDRSNERIRETGEVFTPIPVVDRVLDDMSQSLFKDNARMIDPSCGDGNFLVQALRRKIKYGVSPIEALSTCFGVDLMPDNVQECIIRLLSVAMAADPSMDPGAAVDILDVNIVCHNSLEWDFDKWTAKSGVVTAPPVVEVVPEVVAPPVVPKPKPKPKAKPNPSKKAPTPLQYAVDGAMGGCSDAGEVAITF